MRWQCALTAKWWANRKTRHLHVRSQAWRCCEAARMTALSQFGTRARRVTAPREATAGRSTQADAAAQGVFWIAAALLGVGSVALLLNAYAIAPSHLDALLPLGMFYLAIAVSESIPTSCAEPASPPRQGPRLKHARPAMSPPGSRHERPAASVPTPIETNVGVVGGCEQAPHKNNFF